MKRAVKLWMVVSCGLWLNTSLVLGTPDELAKSLLAMAGGVSNGVCAVPRCGDGSLTVALATNSGFIVYATDPSPTNVVTARTAAGTSLLGRTLYVEQGDASAIGVASEMVDLLVVTDLTDGQLSSFPTGEVMRVISPLVGRAILGSTTGGLTRSVLEAWIQSFGVGGRVVENGQGMWGIVGRAALPGAGDWTHPYCGPDNNTMSTDSAFTLPSDLSWLARPYHTKTRCIGNRLISNGRLFVAWGATDEYKLRAYNLYNGLQLWERNLETNTWASRSLTAVVQGEKLYVTQYNGVQVWDVVTGTNVAAITFTNAAGQSKWMAISTNVLVMLVGPQDPQDTGPMPRTQFWSLRDSKDLGYGQLVVAYDLEAGEEKWRVQEDVRIDARSLGISDGKVFYDAPGARVVCRELQTGNVVWTNSTPELQALLSARNGTIPDDWWGVPDSQHKEDRMSVICSKDVLFFGFPEGTNLVAISAQTGDLLWSKPATGPAMRSLLCLTNLVCADRFNAEPQMYDRLTGAVQASYASPSFGGCGAYSGSAKYLVGANSGIGYDLARMSIVSKEQVYPVKTLCQEGAAIAGGRFVGFTKTCHCTFLRGSVGAGSGKMYNSPTGELQVASGDYTSVVGFPIDDRDWPTHRANSQHNGVSPASVPTSLTNLWQTAARYSGQVFSTNQWLKTTQYALDLPIAACGRIFLAGSEGLVQCLEASSGAELWRYQTEGPVLASPTIADGRLFVSSADGWVYALEAYSGRFLWRYRVGPENRKIMVYGQLQSSWPVNSGVYHESNTVYVSAALPMQPGSYVCALNATTGAEVWRNSNMGPVWVQSTGYYTNAAYVPAGYMTMFQGRLWTRRYISGGDGGISFNPTTGTKYNDTIKESWEFNAGGIALRGREIGTMGTQFLFYGGHDVYMDNTEYEGKWRFYLTQFTNGAPRMPIVNLCSDAVHATPAWSDQKMLMAGTIAGQRFRFECWSTPATIQYVSDLIASNSTGKRIDIPKTPPLPMMQWGVAATNVYSMVLSSNLAVIAVMTNNSTMTQIGGRLKGYDLASGTKTWEIILPKVPLRNGVTIDRDGRILVGLHDGSVIAYGNTYQLPGDSDADGIPDGWMLERFGHATGQAGDKSRASDDADGDGMTNWEEYKAGTLPRDSASRLKVEQTQSGGSGFVIQFSSVLGKWYRVEYRSTLTAADPWQTLINNVAGTGGTVSVTDSAAVGQSSRFYRVIVLP